MGLVVSERLGTSTQSQGAGLYKTIGQSLCTCGLAKPLLRNGTCVKVDLLGRSDMWSVCVKSAF